MKSLPIPAPILALAIHVAMLPAGAHGAAITIRNTLDDGTGAYAIATESFTSFDNTDSNASNDGFAVIGKMDLPSGSISGHFASGNIAAIQSAFQQFSTPFTLESTGLSGAFLDTRNASTKASENGFGGSLIYVWIYKGASIATATEHLILQLPVAFPTDPEVGASLFANAFVRPTDGAQLIVGGFGNFSFDYDAGSGPLPGYNTTLVVPEPATASLTIFACVCIAAIQRRRRNSRGAGGGIQSSRLVHRSRSA